MVSGPARTGKTTALTQLGKTVEVIHRRRHPRSAGDIPVVYITVPPAATPKMIAMEFARFFGLPLSRRANITDIANAVCGVSLDAHVTLVEVDELHNLNTATRAGAEASDTLKYFTERIPATFAYAGISLDRTGLLSGTRGEQIAGRFSIVRTGPFSQDQQWTALIAAVEDSLRLHRHRPGTLHQPGPLPAPAHPRHDREPAVADPQRRHRRRPGRHREDHQEGPGRRRGRHHLPIPAPAGHVTRADAAPRPSREDPHLSAGRIAGARHRQTSSATARKPSAITCTSAGHPESGPSAARPASPMSSPTTAASGSPRTRICGPAALFGELTELGFRASRSTFYRGLTRRRLSPPGHQRSPDAGANPRQACAGYPARLPAHLSMRWRCRDPSPRSPERCSSPT